MKKYTEKEIASIYKKIDIYVSEKYNNLEYEKSDKVTSGNAFISSYDIKGTKDKIVCKLIIKTEQSSETSSWIASKNSSIFAKPEKIKG